jgi:hypothetical protein
MFSSTSNWKEKFRKKISKRFRSEASSAEILPEPADTSVVPRSEPSNAKPTSAGRLPAQAVLAPVPIVVPASPPAEATPTGTAPALSSPLPPIEGPLNETLPTRTASTASTLTPTHAESTSIGMSATQDALLPDATAPSRIEATPIGASSIQAGSSITPAPPCDLSGRLWEIAYEKAKESDAEIVDAYERILSTWLHRSETVLECPKSADGELENKISPDIDCRREQMQQIMQYMQEKAEMHAETRQKFEKGIGIFTILKELGNTAVKASPEAALAWGGVCCVVEVCFATYYEHRCLKLTYAI